MRCTSLPTAGWSRLSATVIPASPRRRRITVLELQQIIGRGRGLWRTADNPLHVLVLTDVALDMPVEELTTDAAERPSFEDRQIAVGAIAFECAAHAAKAFPECGRMPTGHSMRADSTAEASPPEPSHGNTGLPAKVRDRGGSTRRRT